jgi:hypothetical protein
VEKHAVSRNKVYDTVIILYMVQGDHNLMWTWDSVDVTSERAEG